MIEVQVRQQDIGDAGWIDAFPREHIGETPQPRVEREAGALLGRVVDPHPGVDQQQRVPATHQQRAHDERDAILLVRLRKPVPDRLGHLPEHAAPVEPEAADDQAARLDATQIPPLRHPPAPRVPREPI